MVKMKKGDRGRQAWHDTVSQLARETGAALVCFATRASTPGT